MKVSEMPLHQLNLLPEEVGELGELESTTVVNSTHDKETKLYSVQRVIVVDGESKINEAVVHATDEDHAMMVAQDEALPVIIVEFNIERVN